jgi:hypothetical protein
LPLPYETEARHHRRLVALRWRWTLHAIAPHLDDAIQLGQFQIARFLSGRRQWRTTYQTEKVQSLKSN